MGGRINMTAVEEAAAELGRRELPMELQAILGVSGRKVTMQWKCVV